MTGCDDLNLYENVMILCKLLCRCDECSDS